MAATTAEYIALDGSTVRVTADNPRRVATSYLICQLDGRTQEIGAGGLTYGREVATDVGIETFHSEYTHQGGRLLVGAGMQFDRTTGIADHVQISVWEGRSTSLKATRYGSDVGTSELVGIFDQFVISEHEHGVSIAPRDNAPVSILRDSSRRPDLVTRTAGCRRLHTWQLTPETAAVLPSWQGKVVTGGELFVDGQYDEPAFTYVLVGGSAVSRIYPPRSASETDSVAGASNINVDWKR